METRPLDIRSARVKAAPAGCDFERDLRTAATDVEHFAEDPVGFHSQPAATSPLARSTLRVVAHDSVVQAFFEGDASEIEHLAEIDDLSVRWGFFDGGCCAYRSPGFSMFGDPQTKGSAMYISYGVGQGDHRTVEHEWIHRLHERSIERQFSNPATARAAYAKLARIMNETDFRTTLTSPEQKVATRAFDSIRPNDTGAIIRHAPELAALYYQGGWHLGSPDIEAIGSMRDKWLVWLAGELARGLAPSPHSVQAGYEDRKRLKQLLALPLFDRVMPY